MRAYKLLHDLEVFLNKVLADFSLPDPAGNGIKPPRCYFGDVPDDEQSVFPERFPFLIIRWVKGESEEDGGNQEEVALIFGFYAPEGAAQAELISAALLDHVRRALMQLRVLGQSFDLQLPLEAAKPDPERRQHNYHIATIITRWSHQTPRRPLSQGDFNE